MKAQSVLEGCDRERMDSQTTPPPLLPGYAPPDDKKGLWSANSLRQHTEIVLCRELFYLQGITGKHLLFIFSNGFYRINSLS